MPTRKDLLIVAQRIALVGQGKDARAISSPLTAPPPAVAAKTQI